MIKMADCSSVGCTNRPNDRTDLSFHRLPTDGKIRNQWLTNLRRDGKLPKTITVCIVCIALALATSRLLGIVTVY